MIQVMIDELAHIRISLAHVGVVLVFHVDHNVASLMR